jgi:hypothetical protein
MSSRVESMMEWLAERVDEKPEPRALWERFAPESWLANPDARAFVQTALYTPAHPYHWVFALEILADPAAVETAEQLRVEAVRRWAAIRNRPKPEHAWDTRTFWTYGNSADCMPACFGDLTRQMHKTEESLRGKRVLDQVPEARLFHDDEGFMASVLQANERWKLLAETQARKPTRMPQGWWVRARVPRYYQREMGDVFGFVCDDYRPAIDYSLPNPFEPLVALRKLGFQFSYFLEEGTSPVPDDLDCFATCLTVVPNREVEDVLVDVGLMKRW